MMLLVLSGNWVSRRAIDKVDVPGVRDDNVVKGLVAAPEARKPDAQHHSRRVALVSRRDGMDGKNFVNHSE